MSTPTSTYRLQLHVGTDFDTVAGQVTDLAELGVSHLYLSPVLQAVPGTTHGYDVVDPTRLDEALGGEEGFERLCREAREAGLGVVLDVVPNHLALRGPDNRWWWDVLRHGPASRFAAHFDIRWRRRGDGPDQVLVPALAASLEDELTGRDLRVEHAADDGGDVEAGYHVVYHEHAWPLRPGSLAEAGLDPDDVAGTLARLSADPGRRLSLLLGQHYRLVHWRRANRDLNYRRFFDIWTLGGVRMEDPAVFDDVHRRVLALVDEGYVDGLRVDHPDGLADPTGYFEWLRAAAPDAWIIAEKILGRDEQPPAAWPVDGTVGYEFADLVGGLFVQPAGVGVAHDLYAAYADDTGWRATVDAARREVLERLFAGELAELVRLLAAVADEAGAVIAEEQLAEGLRELLVSFSVYRTYVRPEQGALDDADRREIDAAVARARARRADLADPLDLLREVLLLEQGGAHSGELVVRLQQLTGPLAAKGVEDTAFYRQLAFVALNEVGGDPAWPGTTLGAFHAANARRLRERPTTMLTTSTHDTKRGEDVRTRLATLSELPGAWVRLVEDLLALAAHHRGRHGPSARHELLVFQTLVGAWPIDGDRLVDYLVKAARESKHESDWLDPDEGYEADLAGYARAVLGDEVVRVAIERFLDDVVEPGRLSSLSQTLLKLTAPGVPDVYQGRELWDLSLVDPDNRRPVDRDVRRRLLADARTSPHPVELLAGMDRGVPKLWITRQALRLRRERPGALGHAGSYEPLFAEGRRADHVVAFVRGGEVVTVAPRLVVGLGGRFPAWDWGDTVLPLPAGRWRCVLSQHVIEASEHGVAMEELLAAFPLALLIPDATPHG